MTSPRIAIVLSVLCLSACSTNRPNTQSESTPSSASESAAANAVHPPRAVTPAEASAEAASTATAPTATATVGMPAPAFELPDLDGKMVRLADLRGKTVVLEWFNPKCPFVNYAHTKGPLKDMAKRVASENLVWLAINSAGEGKQGHGIDVNRKATSEYGLAHPILLDADGSVGRSYGAKKTPHMYVIDPDGKLVYRGAIDNAPFGETEGGAALINYVDVALSALASKQPLETVETPAYGCTVKYAKG